MSPFTFQVREVRGLADAGTCVTDHEAVNLALEQALSQKQDTLIHELLHSVIAQGLKGAFLDVDKSFEETVVAFLAPRLLALLRDNPRLVEYLTS